MVGIRGILVAGSLVVDEGSLVAEDSQGIRRQGADNNQAVVAAPQ